MAPLGCKCRAEEILAEMKTSLGASNCTLLCVNSGAADNMSEKEDLWSAHLSSPIVANPAEKEVRSVQCRLSCCGPEMDWF